MANAVPPVVALFLAVIFWDRANVAGARAGVVVGLVAGGLLFYGIQVAGTIHLHFLLAATLLFALSLAAVILASLWTAPPDRAKARTLMWTRADFDAETQSLRGRPLWQNYRVQGAALLVLTAVIVWIFR